MTSEAPPTALASGIILEEGRYWGGAAWAVAGFFAFTTYLPIKDSISHLIHPPARWRLDVMGDLVAPALMIAINVGMFAVAGYLSILRRKYGAVRFELSTVPGAIGGSLAGTIFTGRPVQLTSNLHLTLACWEHEVTGTRGGNNSMLWHEDQTLSPHLPTDATGTRIPVFFAIPSRCRPSAKQPNRIRWRLTASSPMPGVDFHASFVVPVLKVTQENQVADAAQAYRVSDAPPATIQGRGILLTDDASGGFDVRIAAARHPVVAAQYTAFALVFGATPWVLTRYGAGRGVIIAATIVLGLIALIVGITAWGLWFSRCRFSVRHQSLALTRGQLFFWRTLQFEGADVTRIKTEKTSDSGPTPWYSLELRTRVPKHPLVVIADGLSKHDADLLAARVRAELDLRPAGRKP